MGEFAVHDDDALQLFNWVAKQFDRSGDLMARWPGERRGTVEYAALLVPSGEVGIMVLSETEERESPRYAGFAVGWTRDVNWDEGYRWGGLRPTDSLLSLNQYATFD